MEATLNSGVEQMKVIFDLCDQDNDGLINAQDFRKIGQEHFENQQQVDSLVIVMDPLSTGKISFIMFCRGIETFLLENQQMSSGSESSFASAVSSEVRVTEENCEDFSKEFVHPSGSSAGLSNGYITTNSAGLTQVELVVNSCDEQTFPTNQLADSLPRSSSPTVIVSRDSPTLVGRQLLRRHKLTLPPEGSSQGSTPGEEEEVSRLSDQLHELSSKLEELEEDQKGSEGFGARMKKENTELIARLEDTEDSLRTSEMANQKLLNEIQDKLKITVNKVRRESETQVMDLQTQLQLAQEKISNMDNTATSLRAQLDLIEEDKLKMEEELEEQKERVSSMEKELHRTQDLLRAERKTILVEKESLNQVIRERDLQIQQLQQVCEEIHSERKRKSITASDMDGEVHRLKKKLEQSERQTLELQSRFLREGKQLVTSIAPQSLEMEIESVSKEEVVKALKNVEETNSRLNQYIDGLLTTIMENHPEMLEH